MKINLFGTTLFWKPHSNRIVMFLSRITYFKGQLPLPLCNEVTACSRYVTIVVRYVMLLMVIHGNMDCIALGSSIWRPHTPYGRFWNSYQNQSFNSFQIQTKFNSLYGKKLRKILESKPKPTVALKIVINPAGMALDIKILKKFSAGIKHVAGYVPDGFNCLFNWNCYTFTFFRRGVWSSNGIAH